MLQKVKILNCVSLQHRYFISNIDQPGKEGNVSEDLFCPKLGSTHAAHNCLGPTLGGDVSFKIVYTQIGFALPDSSLTGLL